MIDRRKFVAICGGALLFEPIASLGQPTGKPFRVGYLDPRSSRISADDPSYTNLRRTLTNLGYVAGSNMIFEERFADRQLDRLPALASELVQLKVDVIVAASGPSIRAARDATATIPIVMAFSGDGPVRSGFVASLAHPGGNITGVTVLFRELAPKWVELLRDLVPGMTRLGVMINPSGRRTLSISLPCKRNDRQASSCSWSRRAHPTSTTWLLPRWAPVAQKV